MWRFCDDFLIISRNMQLFKCGRESDRYRKREKERVNERAYACMKNTGWEKGRLCFFKLARLCRDKEEHLFASKIEVYMAM